MQGAVCLSSACTRCESARALEKVCKHSSPPSHCPPGVFGYRLDECRWCPVDSTPPSQKCQHAAFIVTNPLMHTGAHKWLRMLSDCSSRRSGCTSCPHGGPSASSYHHCIATLLLLLLTVGSGSDGGGGGGGDDDDGRGPATFAHRPTRKPTPGGNGDPQITGRRASHSAARSVRLTRTHLASSPAPTTHRKSDRINLLLGREFSN